MKLVYSPTSPFARKVRVAAIERGLSLELVDANPWAADSVVGEHNPLGKVPALLTGNDAIVDSPVICEYLDAHPDGGPKLFPVDGDARWLALWQQAVSDGMMDATVLRRLETLRDRSQQSATWIARQELVIRRTLDALEQRGAPGSGDDVNIGHAAIACALGYLDHRFAEEPWRANRPALASWFETFSTRPSMHQTAPPA